MEGKKRNTKRAKTMPYTVWCAKCKKQVKCHILRNGLFEGECGHVW